MKFFSEVKFFNYLIQNKIWPILSFLPQTFNPLFDTFYSLPNNSPDENKIFQSKLLILQIYFSTNFTKKKTDISSQSLVLILFINHS